MGSLLAVSLIGATGCSEDVSADSSDLITAQSTEALGARGRSAIVGLIYNDADGNGAPSLRERGLRKVGVYLDTNDNGVRDPDEPRTKTNRFGLYRFRNLPAGDYTVRQEVPFGWRNVSGGEGPSPTPPVVVPSAPPSTRIIGGAETAPNEYPFMAGMFVEFSGNLFQFCGGMLITDRWVLTAAHCSEGFLPSEVQVLVGTNDFTNGSGLFVPVRNIYLHPDYVPTPSEPSNEAFSVLAGSDMALWELETPIALSESGLETVGMLSPEDEALADTGALATTVGWGASDLDSLLLQDVHLPIFDSAQCEQAMLSAFPEVTNFDTQICAGVPEGGIDACQGDSGGPLLVRDSAKDQWRVAGLTSYGLGCALPGFPGVWARVSVLSDWAKATAVEPSRAHRVTLRRGSVKLALFGNQSTEYSPSQAIEPRWQLANAGLDLDAQGNVNVNWQILDEAAEDRRFDCDLDPDGQGPAGPSDFFCAAGENQTSLGTLADGVYLPELTAMLGETSFSRANTLIVGTPPETQVSGELAVGDGFDPDFLPGQYYIDYFAIEGLSGDRAMQIKVTSQGFNPFVGLYDRNLRDATLGGGIIAFITPEGADPVATFTFFPEAGTNYLLGVSSFFEEAVGTYEVSLVNDGTPVATTLSGGAPEVSSARAGAFLKMPRLRRVARRFVGPTSARN